MSIEAMKALAQMEAESAAQKKAAEGAAQAQVAEAIRAGNILKVESRGSAEAEAKELLVEVEQSSQVAINSILAEAQVACEHMKQMASERLTQASAHIAERVVSI